MLWSLTKHSYITNRGQIQHEWDVWETQSASPVPSMLKCLVNDVTTRWGNGEGVAHGICDGSPYTCTYSVSTSYLPQLHFKADLREHLLIMFVVCVHVRACVQAKWWNQLQKHMKCPLTDYGSDAVIKTTVLKWFQWLQHWIVQFEFVLSGQRMIHNLPGKSCNI